MNSVGLEFLAGQTLIDQRFEIQTLLGAGASGVVVLATDTQLSFPLALKILYPHLSFNKQSFARFLSETRITMRLSHPNILPTYGIGTHEDKLFYLKMAHSGGGSLKDLLLGDHPNGLPMEILLDYLYQMAQGLRYANERGVVHRDIKPENILISNEGHIQIADFGLAQMIQQETRHTGQGNILGTPLYMSPEQVKAQALDSRTDIYSFAILAYELATGSPPFDGDSFFEVVDQHLNQPYPNPKNMRTEIPDQLATMLEQCAVKEREKRTITFAECAEVLAKYSPIAISGSVLAENTQKYPTTELSEPPNRVFFLLQRKAITLWWILIGCISVSTITILAYRNTEARNHVSALVISLERVFDTELSTIRKMYPIPTVHTDSLFHIADTMGYQVVKIAILAGANPNERRDDGTTILHHVAKEKNAKTMEYLLRGGPEIDSRDANGDTPLMLAIANGKAVTVQLLLENNASLDVKNNNGETVLHLAAQRLSSQDIKTFLKHKLDLNGQDHLGNTALHYAMRREDPELIAVLLEYGCNARIVNHQGVSAVELSDDISNPLVRKEIRALFHQHAKAQ